MAENYGPGIVFSRVARLGPRVDLVEDDVDVAMRAHGPADAEFERDQ